MPVEPHALAHRYPVRVYYEDTDAGGIVYYANYFKFAERARTEMLRQAGMAHSELVRAHGLSLVVSRCEAHYMGAAQLDDMLEVESRILDLGGATLEAEQIVRRDGADLVHIRVLLACINRAGRPVRLPAQVRSLVAAARPTGQEQVSR